VGIVATLASIAVTHALVFRTPRRLHSSSAHETASLPVFKRAAAP
jgi:hypothetical protein